MGQGPAGTAGFLERLCFRTKGLGLQRRETRREGSHHQGEAEGEGKIPGGQDRFPKRYEAVAIDQRLPPRSHKQRSGTGIAHVPNHKSPIGRGHEQGVI